MMNKFIFDIQRFQDIDNSYDDNVVVTGTNDNDSIFNNGNNVTITGGKGNDIINNNNITDYGDNVLFIYNNGDGNDSVRGFKANSTLSIGGGSYSTETSGNDVIVTVGNGKITLASAATLSALNIVGSFEDGDAIKNDADNTLVSGTDEDDVIINSGNDVTINGGTGNDTITNTGSNVVYDYSKGDGNDVINGFGANDTLYIEEAGHPVTVSGNDLIVTVGNGKITLTGAANLENPNITGSYDSLAKAFVINLQQKTESGYPLIAALLFHPNEYHGFETLPEEYYESSETLTINSADGFELTGYHYTPENSNDKWAVIIHGYGHNHNHMNGFAEMYLTNGYNVLMVDQRAAGESEGEWLTMGAGESKDIALWTQKIAELNPNAKITLHGVSMGAATAMLAAANSQTTNVTSLVEDCGYTSVLNLIDIAKGLIPQLADSEFVSMVSAAAESLTGYPLTAAAPIDSIGKATVPSMFITGEADTVVPISNLESLYSASGAKVKEIFTVAGATHGLSALTDSVGYANTVFRFNAEAAGEGWATSNTVDAISLTGTKYNDTISNSGNEVTISAVAGNDTIINVDNSKTYLDGGVGDDLISNSLNYYVVTLASGQESLVNEYSDTTIVAGAGNDTVVNVGGFNASIVAGEGDDAIYTKHSYYNTIDAGTGNDYVRIAEGHYQNVFLGDGNDTIQGVQEMDTIISGNWDVGGYANLDGGNGDDVISFGYSNNSTITGGAGNDYIVGFGANSFITGGDGDDKIVLVATKESQRDSTGATVSGGKGNDTIVLADADVVYSYEGGNEEIWGVTEGDTIAISTNDTYRTNVSGDDLLILFKNSQDTITLKNAATITPYIDGITVKSDKAGQEIENPVAMIASGNDTYYYESVARATDDADEGSTVTVIADSTETAQINATKDLTIQFAESDTGVYNVTGGNFVTAADIEGFTADSVISGGGNILSIANGSTATFGGYEVTGSSNGHTFALQNDIIPINGIEFNGEGTATFDKNGNISLTSGAVATMPESDTATFNLSAGQYTLNGNTVSATAANAITVDSDTASFNVSSDTFTYNTFEFSGKGAASVANDLPTLTAGVEVNRDERAMVVLTESGQNTIDGRGFWMTEDLADGITVGAVDNGIGAAHIIPYESFPEDAGKLFAEEALIYGDDSYTVRLNKDGIKNIYGLSAGSTVRGTAYFEGEVDTLGSILQLVVDSSGSYTFGNKTYTLNGAVDSVNVVAFSSRFYTEGTSALKDIYYLNGTVSGDFSSEVKVNQASMGVQVLGDTNISVYATDSAKPIDDAGKDSISSAGQVSVISGVGNGSSIISAGGATKVSTNEEGVFTFRSDADTQQGFTVTGDDSVDFILQNYTDENGNATMQVAGVNNFENGFYTISKDSAYHAINAGENIAAGDELVIGFADTATFVIADSKVVSVNGVDYSINRLKGDVAVHATNAITVNEVYADVEGDDDFDVIVADSKTAGFVNISAGASIKVASVDIMTDNNGEFKVGEYVYNVNDTVDGNVTFTTDANGAVKDINDFTGTLNTSARNVTVNGSAFTTTNTDVTITSADNVITQVEGLVNGDSISGALDSATVIISANEDSDTVEVAVNSTGYTLTGDTTGLEIKDDVISGLDSGAKLQISAAGVYNVNGATLITKVGDTIVGTAEGSAYIYDPNNLPLDVTNMSDDSISAQVGISNSYTSVQTDTNVAGLAVANDGASTMNGTMALALDNTGANIAQTADFSNTTGRKRVTLEGGDQGVKFNDEGGNVAVIDEDATGEKNITLGNGGDLAIIKETSTPVNITTGAGKDTVVTAGSDVFMNMGIGAARIIANAGNVTLNNYNAATGAGIHLNGVVDILSAIESGAVSLNKGSISFDKTNINFANEDANSAMMNLYNTEGKKFKVAYTSGEGGVAGSSTENEDMYLFGMAIDESASLIGGSGNDTAVAGSGGLVDLGSGNNYIALRNNSGATTGAVIGFTATEGKTEVDGFNGGFNENSDRVSMDVSQAKVKYKGGKLIFTNGGSTLTLNGIGSSADLAESADLLADDNFITGTTLDDITPVTCEQGEYQNLYDATFATAQNTILAISE